MTKDEARKMIGNYIAKEAPELSIVRYDGETYGTHYFVCKTNNWMPQGLPGETDMPTLAVLGNP